MINKVYTYSPEEAKKNGNDKILGSFLLILLLSAIIIMISYFVIVVLLNNLSCFLFAIVFELIGLPVWIGANLGMKNRSRLSGFATDNNNNVYYYYIMTVDPDNSESIIIPGVMIDGNFEPALYRTSTSSEEIQNPKIIKELLEISPEYMKIKQILKVHNYTENSHKITIKCDYRIMKSGITKYNKKMTIYKSYNSFDELMNILLNV